VSIESFGCRVNLAEGDAIAAFARNATVINTCAVTAEAVRQGRQAVRRAAATGVPVIATGCAVQLDPAGFAALPGVVGVLGNVEKMDAANYAGTGARVGDIMAARAIALPRVSPGRHTRGFVAVQTGCDHRCTFCIIPFARGPSRSLGPDAIVDHVRALAAAGCNEVVLTGVDLTSFGPEPLGRLVQRILREVPALPRLRLSSLDSVEIDDALVEALAEPRLMPHLHLSLQSGADLILKRMRRRHSRTQAVAVTERVRRARPGIALGADLIAGFPTETEAHFTQSLALIDDCGLSAVHVFPFSPRPGTPAARMPPVPAAAVRDRAARLRARGAERRGAALAAQVGQPQRVLVEAGGLTGHTETFLPARLATPSPRGSIAEVVATGVSGNILECA
jgi:threonylcarbamoyladenosine tRNA methylthiotransferase MtaB